MKLNGTIIYSDNPNYVPVETVPNVSGWMVNGVNGQRVELGSVYLGINANMSGAYPSNYVQWGIPDTAGMTNALEFNTNGFWFNTNVTIRGAVGAGTVQITNGGGFFPGQLLAGQFTNTGNASLGGTALILDAGTGAATFNGAIGGAASITSAGNIVAGGRFIGNGAGNGTAAGITNISGTNVNIVFGTAASTNAAGQVTVSALNQVTISSNAVSPVNLFVSSSNSIGVGGPGTTYSWNMTANASVTNFTGIANGSNTYATIIFSNSTASTLATYCDRVGLAMFGAVSFVGSTNGLQVPSGKRAIWSFWFVGNVMSNMNNILQQ
jgi:hypothetical protein